eukprot:4805384-Amphidinium_carterae.1
MVTVSSEVVVVEDDGRESDLECRDDVMEVFSPERVNPYCRALGLLATTSIDMLSRGGEIDLSTPTGRAFALQKQRQLKPMLLVLSPPCTMFSALNRINKARVPDEVWQQRLRAGKELLQFAVFMAREQAVTERFFILEHPAGASSWKLDEVQSLKQDTGAEMIVFDQCRFNLRSPPADGSRPIQKRTCFLSNATEQVTNEFSQKFCNCSCKHRRIEGRVAGVQLSSYCALYPPELCRAIARVAMNLKVA